ncbi:MAG: chemotaxis protein CheC [bacterium]
MDAAILENIRSLFEQGAALAGQSMEMMLGRELEIRVNRIAEVSYEDLYEGLYPPETPMAIIVIRIAGDNSGYLVFLMFEENAKKLNEVLWSGIPFDDGVVNLSNLSALKELTNVVGNSFLNTLADRVDCELRPTEPFFVYDMLAAVLEGLIVEHSLVADKAVLIDTNMAETEKGIGVHFLFLPSPKLVETITAHLS